MKLPVRPLPALFAALLLAGCSRKEPEWNVVPSGNCRISSVGYDSYNLALSYRDDDLLESADEVSKTVIRRSYAYSGDSLLVVTHSPAGGSPVLSIDSIWVNARGMVLRHRVHSDYFPDTESETFFRYDASGEQLQQRLQVNFASGDSTLTTYEWTAGDPVYSTINGITYVNEFDGQTAAKQGDHFQIHDLIVYGGYRTLRSRHLATQIEAIDISYGFNNRGDIVRLGENESTRSYTYGCK